MTPSEQRAEELARECADFTHLLKAAQDTVKDYPLYNKFIDGTPLENDMATMMATFAMCAIVLVLKQSLPFAQYEACVEALRNIVVFCNGKSCRGGVHCKECDCFLRETALTAYDTFMKERNKR